MVEELPIEKTKRRGAPVLITSLGLVLIIVGIFAVWKISSKNNDAISIAPNSTSSQSDNQVVVSTTSALELAKTNEGKSKIHYDAGIVYYNENKLDLAESEQMEAIKLSQKSPRPYAALSAIYLGRSNFEQALNYAQDAINIDGISYPWGYNNKGIALMSLGRSAEAIVAFKKAVAISPDMAVFKQNLAKAQEEASSTKK